ncbi:MAG: methyltransferase domain-containing protein [Roseiflexaceae bacterium]
MDDLALKARSLNRLGNWLSNTGRSEEGLQAHQDALRLFEQQQDTRGMAETFDLLGTTYGMRGDRVKAVELLGQAIDVSAGQGRNAVFLAKAGWDVIAVDVSEVGLQIAARNAQEVGVKLHTRHQSIQQLDYGAAQWDLIVMTYAPVPLTQPDAVARIIAALRPKGIVVVETYASDEGAPGRRPIDLDPAKLRSAWSNAHITHFEDIVAVSDWDRQATRRDPAGRERSGVHCYCIVRPLDDPNYVMIDLDFDSASEVQAFLAAMRKAGRSTA